MLSQHDRRALAVIEEQLTAEAPELAQLLARFGRGTPQPRRTRQRATWCVVVLGVVLLGVALALRSADLLFVSTMALTYGAVRCAVTVAAHAVARRRSARTP